MGIYTEGLSDETLITENFLYHNGWLPEGFVEGRNWRSHNMYHQSINGKFRVAGNFVVKGAATGVQQRAGGDNVCNVYAENAIGLYINYGEQITHNIITETTDIAPNEDPDQNNFRRGWGMQIYRGSPTVTNIYGLYRLGTGRPDFLDVTESARVDNNFVHEWPLIQVE